MSDDNRIATLEEQVNNLMDAFAHQDEALGRIGDYLQGLEGQRADAPTRAWTCFEADEDVLAAQMESLRSWLAWVHPTVLFPRNNYRGLPPCWEEHPGAVEELLALYAAWLGAYASKDPNEGPIAWHDRWVSPALERLTSIYGLEECRTAGHHAVPAPAESMVEDAQAVQQG